MTVCLELLCSCRVNWEQTDTWIRISTLKELKTSAQFYKYKNKMTFWGLSSSTPLLVEGARFSLQSASELSGCCNCCCIVCVRCCSTVNTCLMTKSGTLSLSFSAAAQMIWMLKGSASLELLSPFVQGLQTFF